MVDYWKTWTRNSLYQNGCWWIFRTPNAPNSIWPNFIFFNCHGCRLLIWAEFHWDLCPPIFEHNNLFLGSVDCLIWIIFDEPIYVNSFNAPVCNRRFTSYCGMLKSPISRSMTGFYITCETSLESCLNLSSWIFFEVWTCSSGCVKTNQSWPIFCHFLSLRYELRYSKYNGIQPAIKARSKTKLGSRKNQGRGLICARASRAYTNLFVNSERSEHLK